MGASACGGIGSLTSSGFKSSGAAADSASVDQWDAGVLTPAADLRCPACAAAVRPDAPWCTLCYHDLRPAEVDAGRASEPVVAPLPDPVDRAYGGSVLDPADRAYGGSVLDPLTAPAEALGLPATRSASAGAGGAARAGAGISWPCGACGCGNPIDLSACAGCGAGFLAGVREGEGPLLDLPVVGDLTALTRAQRIWLAASVVLAFIALTVVLVLISN